MIKVYIKNIKNELLSTASLDHPVGYVVGISAVSCIVTSNNCSLALEGTVSMEITDDMTMNDIKASIASIFK